MVLRLPLPVIGAPSRRARLTRAQPHAHTASKPCCSGYSGAQLANLVNVAATVASQAGREEIQNSDLEKVRAAG